MAKATAYCTCKHCGAQFVQTKDCFSRDQANSWESWAAENLDICPECYRAQKAQEAKEKSAQAVADYNLPTITGVSEKQIAFANTLRTRFIAGRNSLDSANKLLHGIDPATLEKVCADQNVTPEVAIANAFHDYNMDREYVVLSTGSASKLIDILK